MLNSLDVNSSTVIKSYRISNTESQRIASARCQRTGLPERGRYKGSVGRERFDLVPGQGIIYPAHTPHRGQADRDGSVRLLYCNGMVMQSLRTPVCSMIHLDKFGIVCFGNGLPMDDANRDGQRHAIMIALLEQIRWQTDKNYFEPIAEMHRFMETTCEHPITMDLLSRRSGMAVSTINQKFRARYGIPPMQFLQRVRAHAAANFLRSSNQDLETIAQLVGLRSVSHLSNMLKKHVGMSARDLRRAQSIQRPRKVKQ